MKLLEEQRKSNAKDSGLATQSVGVTKMGLLMVKKKTNESPSPSGSTRSTAKSKHFLASQKFLQETKGVGIINELKSLTNLGNLTGSNAIESALGINGKGKGLSATQRVTSGLTGVVQGLTFAAGSGGGRAIVDDIRNTINPPINNYYTHGGPKLEGGVLDPVYGRGGAKFDYTQNPNSAIRKRAETNTEFVASASDDAAITKQIQDSPLSINAFKKRKINQLIKSGEKHHTVIDAANTQRSIDYASQVPVVRDAAGRALPDAGGFVHVFEIPRNLRSRSTGGPGEVNVYGKHKPIASFPSVGSGGLKAKTIDDFIATHIKNKNKRR